MTAPQSPPQTHAEALLGNRIGLPPSPCGGTLRATGVYPDTVLHDGQVVTREVTLLHCDACGAFLPHAEGAILNDYQRPTLAVPAAAGLVS